MNNAMDVVLDNERQKKLDKMAELIDTILIGDVVSIRAYDALHKEVADVVYKHTSAIQELKDQLIKYSEELNTLKKELFGVK